MVMGMLLEKRINSCFLLLHWFSGEKRGGTYTGLPINIWAVVEITGLPVLSFASSYNFVVNYQINCAYQI